MNLMLRLHKERLSKKTGVGGGRGLGTNASQLNKILKRKKNIHHKHEIKIILALPLYPHFLITVCVFTRLKLPLD